MSYVYQLNRLTHGLELGPRISNKDDGYASTTPSIDVMVLIGRIEHVAAEPK